MMLFIRKLGSTYGVSVIEPVSYDAEQSSEKFKVESEIIRNNQNKISPKQKD